MPQLDCVILGHFEVDFNRQCERYRRTANRSGIYDDLKFNSVLHQNQRKNYMQLLNDVVTSATGHDRKLSSFELPSLGASYLTNYLRKRGFAVELVNYLNKDRDQLLALLEEEPRAVAITTTYYVDPEPIQELVAMIREHRPAQTIIVGGPFINGAAAAASTLVLKSLLRSLGADVYITEAQGERTLATVLARLRGGGSEPLNDVPNLLYRDGAGQLQRTAREVESVPLTGNSVDWSGFSPSLFVPTTYVRTARSCPFSCAFCNYPTMSGAHQLLDVEELERELIQLYQLGVRNLIFIDDTFNVPLARFKKILRMMIANGFNFRWVSFFRCSNCDDEAFDLMERSGCLGVYLGIESGDQQMLERMNKFARVDKYLYGIKSLSDRGIMTYGSFIAGFPGETERSIDNTIAFIDKAKPTFYNVLLYFHDTVSPIQQRAAEFGLTGAQYSWSHATMDWRTAAGHVRRMFESVQGSIPCPLYGFAIWSIPYLLQRGFNLESIQRFTARARGLFVDSFDDVDRTAEHHADLVRIFQTPNTSAPFRSPGRAIP